jgi:hypothetical protein
MKDTLRSQLFLIIMKLNVVLSQSTSLMPESAMEDTSDVLLQQPKDDMLKISVTERLIQQFTVC